MTLREQINEQCAIITGAKNYLHDTDYLGHREYEGGEPMPAEIETKRAEARVTINEARAVIAELEEQLAQEEAAIPEPIGEEVSHNE